MGIWIFEMPLTFSTDHEQISGTFLPLTIMWKTGRKDSIFQLLSPLEEERARERERERERMKHNVQL